ncbi:MAG: PTS sugar transporter subunit IIA [Myxococcaceae bacterium]
MVGLVVASHGRLADELVATARQIVGDLPRVATLSVEPQSSPDDIRNRMRDAVKSVDDGEGVLVFADLIGGSPCTQGLSLCQQARIEVVTGVNLPMLLKANSLRAEVSLRDLAHQLAQYGQKNITCASELLRARAPAA